jgi:hypothetical protein
MASREQTPRSASSNAGCSVEAAVRGSASSTSLSAPTSYRKNSPMTEQEITRELNRKYRVKAANWPSQQPRAKRKAKLRLRLRTVEALDYEITRTEERLAILIEMREELRPRD